MMPIEIDELYREVHALQHRASELESRLNALEGRQALLENAQNQQGAVNEANLRSHEQILSVLESIKNAFEGLANIGKPTEDDNENDAKISQEWKESVK